MYRYRGKEYKTRAGFGRSIGLRGDRLSKVIESGEYKGYTIEFIEAVTEKVTKTNAHRKRLSGDANEKEDGCIRYNGESYESIRELGESFAVSPRAIDELEKILDKSGKISKTAISDAINRDRKIWKERSLYINDLRVGTVGEYTAVEEPYVDIMREVFGYKRAIDSPAEKRILEVKWGYCVGNRSRVNGQGTASGKKKERNKKESGTV